MTFDRDTGDLVDAAELVREQMEADAIAAALHGRLAELPTPVWHIDDDFDPDDDTDADYAGYRHTGDDCAEDAAMHIIDADDDASAYDVDDLDD